MPIHTLVQAVELPPKLPTELLSLIFQACLDTEDHFLGCPRVSATTPPLTLTWVCREWRALVMSMPELWSGFSLGYKLGTYPREEDTALMKLFLDRAGGISPLHVELAYGNESDVPLFDANSLTGRAQRESYLEGMRLLVETLAPVQHRCRTLAVSGLIPESLQPFLDLLRSDTPQLEYLVLSSQHLTVEGHPGALELYRCPRLHTLALLCPGVHPRIMLNEDDEHRPIDGLTALTLGCEESQPDALNWLIVCPNLESLSINFTSDAAPIMLPFSGPVHLPRLAHLQIGAEWPNADPGALLWVLRLPALRSLSLVASRPDVFEDDSSVIEEPGADQQPWDWLAGLLRHSNLPPLEALELRGSSTPLAPVELLEVLSLTPSLTKLTINNRLATEDVLCAMAGGSEGETPAAPLCPALRSLQIDDYARRVEPLAHMLLARCYRATSEAEADENQGTRSHTLEMLTLRGSASSQIALLDHPALEECRRRGVVIVSEPSIAGASDTQLLDPDF